MSSSNIHRLKSISEEVREALTGSLRTYDSQFKQLNVLSKRIIQKFDTEDAANSAKPTTRDQLVVDDTPCSSLSNHSPRVVLPATLPIPQATPAEWTSPSGPPSG